jgi:hypothetical protein
LLYTYLAQHGSNDTAADYLAGREDVLAGNEANLSVAA